MGTLAITTIVNKVATLLFDVNNVKWGRKELLGWVNDGQRAIVSLIPESTSIARSVKMVAGSRQTIPTDAWMLLEISRNMGASPGTTPGRALGRFDRTVMDQTNPTWYADAATQPVNVYAYNLRDRAGYYVYPPSDGNGYLELILSIMPSEQLEGDILLLNDLYVPGLIDYVMWRCLSKGAAFADPARSDGYARSFAMYVQANAGDAAKLAAEMGNPKSSPSQTQGSGGGG